jgi:hypothetical protein
MRSAGRERVPTADVYCTCPPQVSISVEQDGFGKLGADHRGGAIGGAVVDNDHTELTPALILQALQAVTGKMTAVVYRYYDMDSGLHTASWQCGE